LYETKPFVLSGTYCKWKKNFAAFGRKVCRKRLPFVKKIGSSADLVKDELVQMEDKICRSGKLYLPN